MPHDILNSMRALREDMRQRLMEVPEYRALMALDRSIDEICDILQGAIAGVPPMAAARLRSAPEAAIAEEQVAAPMPAPMPEPTAHPARQGAIASAFAETLAAKLDQRNVARAGASYLPSHNGRAG